MLHQYLETARNPYGLIGGINSHCFGEGYNAQRSKPHGRQRQAVQFEFIPDTEVVYDMVRRHGQLSGKALGAQKD